MTGGPEIEVAEKVRDLVPCAERVAFGKNGSDVLAMAVRVARAFRGKDKVLCCGYHGIHDWYMAGVPGCPGIPAVLRDLILPVPYNDLHALEARLDTEGGETACLVMEPVAEVLPDPGYLDGVRSLTRKHGVVLIFDEIMTGLRLAPGGAQERYGVTPDLACLAKCMANGMPLSALAGPDELAEALSAVKYGLTFRGEVLSLAAASAVLDLVRDRDVSGHLWTTGDLLREGFEECARRHGVPMQLTGPSPRLTFRVRGRHALSNRGLTTLFMQECIAGGVLHNGNLLPSLAHDEAAVDRTLEVFDAALTTVARALNAGNLGRYLHIPLTTLWLEDDIEDGEASG